MSSAEDMALKRKMQDVSDETMLMQGFFTHNEPFSFSYCYCRVFPVLGETLQILLYVEKATRQCLQGE